MLKSPVIKVSIIIVSIYDAGSLLPLSNSNKGAVPSFKLSFFDRKIENTEAASVELITEPIKKLINIGSFKI